MRIRCLPVIRYFSYQGRSVPSDNTYVCNVREMRRYRILLSKKLEQFRFDFWRFTSARFRSYPAVPTVIIYSQSFEFAQFNIPSGVPQGDHLSTLFFIICFCR